jgi:hypothetical protein
VCTANDDDRAEDEKEDQEEDAEEGLVWLGVLGIRKPGGVLRSSGTTWSLARRSCGHDALEEDAAMYKPHRRRGKANDGP